MPKEVAPPLDNGRYRLYAVLGRGSMATVYRARDTHKNVDRAVKVCGEQARSGVLRKRFFREAETMARLQHPNIVQVHDLGEEDARPYMVMELMVGSSVGRALKRFGALPEFAAGNIVRAVLEALEYAHDQGIVHRDVKPGNVLLTDRGVAKLADFGIAHMGDQTTLTRTGAVMGSWPYMAPEQRGSATAVDSRSDVFSCGAMLYALARAQEPRDIYVPQQREVLLRGFSPAYRQIIAKATERRAADRYGSAIAMAHAIEAMEDLFQQTAPTVRERSVDSETFVVEE